MYAPPWVYWVVLQLVYVDVNGRREDRQRAAWLADVETLAVCAVINVLRVDRRLGGVLIRRLPVGIEMTVDRRPILRGSSAGGGVSGADGAASRVDVKMVPMSKIRDALSIFSCR